MKTIMMLLKCLESIISYNVRKIASDSSLTAAMGVIIHDLVIGIICTIILGLFAFTVGKLMFLIIINLIIIGILTILLLHQNRILIKTMKGIVSRERFLQRVEVGVNP